MLFPGSAGVLACMFFCWLDTRRLCFKPSIEYTFVLIQLFCRHAHGCYVVLDSKVLHRLGIKTSRHTLHRASRQDADNVFSWERRRPRLHPPTLTQANGKANGVAWRRWSKVTRQASSQGTKRHKKAYRNA